MDVSKSTKNGGSEYKRGNHKHCEYSVDLAMVDLKIDGKLLTHHRRGYGVYVETLRNRFPLRWSTGKGPKMGSRGYRRLRRWN